MSAATESQLLNECFEPECVAVDVVNVPAEGRRFTETGKVRAHDSDAANVCAYRFEAVMIASKPVNKNENGGRTFRSILPIVSG